jgi:hypothetical protein
MSLIFSIVSSAGVFGSSIGMLLSCVLPCACRAADFRRTSQHQNIAQPIEDKEEAVMSQV